MLQFRNSVKTAEIDVLTARLKLQTLLGRKPGEGTIDIIDSLKTPLPPKLPDLTTIQAGAMSVRPDLQAARLDQARSQAELRLQLAEGKVDYTVGMEYRRQQGVNGTGNSLGFFVSVPLPVYNRNQGEIARVQSEQQQLQKQMESLQAQVQGEVVEAYHQFDAARSLIVDIEKDLLGAVPRSPRDHQLHLPCRPKLIDRSSRRPESV